MARRARATRERDRGAGLEVDAGVSRGRRHREIPIDSFRAARGPHRQHRHAGRRERRLRRRARNPVLPASGVGHREEAAEVGAGRRARRNVTALRAVRRENRARMDRSGRGGPRDARLLRAALGRRSRRSGRERARAAVRTDPRPAAARFPRRHRPEDRARGVHSRGARPWRARDERQLPAAQPEARRRGDRARAQGAAAGRAGRRRRHCRVLCGACSRKAFIPSRPSNIGARESSATIPLRCA